MVLVRRRGESTTRVFLFEISQGRARSARHIGMVGHGIRLLSCQRYYRYHSTFERYAQSLQLQFLIVDLRVS